MERMDRLKTALVNADKAGDTQAAQTLAREIRRLQGEDKGLWQSAKEIVTGEGRQEFDLPTFDVPIEFSGRQAKTAFGLMTTFDPKREVAILKENYPDLKFSEDRFGNVIVNASAYDGTTGYLNKPGVSLRDIADLGFQVAAFTPAAKAGSLAATTVGRMGAVGAASAGTQSAMDLAGQAAGATNEISPSNIEAGDVAIAGLGGGLFEGVGILAARLMPKFKKAGGRVTGAIRQQFKKAAQDAGKDPNTVTDDVIASFMRKADEAVDPAMADSAELGIPYTKGQATGDIKQLQLEDTLRHGGLGPKAQQTMETFAEQQQAPAIQAATARQQAALSGGNQRIEQTRQAGEMVREGVKSRAATMEDAIEDAYAQVGNASIKPEGLKDLTKSMLKTTRSVDFERNPELAPASASLVKELGEFDEMVSRLGAKIRPAHISKLESFRRRLNSKINTAKNPTDRRQVIMMKNAFDDYLDSAVDNALFTGDETALDALKNARQIRAEYAKKFQRRDTRTKGGRIVKDDAGDIIERMVAADPTDEQVVNYLFGSSKLGGRQSGAKLAERLKSALGEQSQEWQAVREAAFLKLTEPNKQGVISGQQMLSRLTDAMESSPTLMKALYSPDEIKQIRRLGAAIKRAQPDPMNPSKTAYKGAQIAQQAWEHLLTSMGFNVGGPAGAVAARGAAEGAKSMAGWRAARAAKSATKRAERPLRRLNAGGVGAVVSNRATSE